MEEDRPRARRGRVVPIQFVGPHQCREEQCSVTHCGRPRATSPAPTRQHKTTYRKQFRTPSTVHQVGATAHHRQNDGTMELSSALLCPALPCSGAPPALCIRIAQNSSQLQNSKTSFSSIALSCVSSHAPRPMLVEQGAPPGSCTACRLSANDPRAVQDGPGNHSRSKGSSLWFLVSPCDGRASEPCEHTGLSLRRGDYSITVLLAGASYRDGFDSQL